MSRMKRQTHWVSIGACLLLTVAVSAQNSQAPDVVFPKAKLNIQEGEKKKEIDALIGYYEKQLVIADKDRRPLKTLPYDAIKSAEYSYSKSPRYKAGMLVSPFLLFTSGKKHWLTLQADKDFVILQMDKSNYKLIVATFEAKSGKKVETVADSK
jgi:hypothetical protein